MTPRADLLVSTDRGLHCPAGDFFVDPWAPVERAVLTHAHADHARPGSRRYLCAAPGAGVARKRVGDGVEALEYGREVRLGDARVSLHPAGHVLGSAQVRIEVEGEVWVVAGDYKTAPDPTCAPLEPQDCDVFVTESTFGLPVYRWPSPAELSDELREWWEANRAAGRTSLLLAYALGKAQRALAMLADPPGPIAVHGAVERLNAEYRAAGVALPDAPHLTPALARELRGQGLVIAPPSAGGTPWARKLGDASVALASGWMRLRGPRRRRNVDRGLVLSDHADWPGLLATIEATGASRVLVTHGHVEPLVRYLRERGLDAAPLASRWVGEPGGDEDEQQDHAGSEEDAP